MAEPKTPRHRVVALPRPVWFVVNMCSRWSEKEFIHRGQKPYVVYHTLAEAYAEAVRQAEAHSQGDYAVFESIGRIRSVKRKKPVEPGTLAGT